MASVFFCGTERTGISVVVTDMSHCQFGGEFKHVRTAAMVQPVHRVHKSARAHDVKTALVGILE